MATQDDLDKLEAAVARGSRRVTFSDGRQVEFVSFEELVNRINYIKQQLGQATSERRNVARFTKGVQA